MSAIATAVNDHSDSISFCSLSIAVEHGKGDGAGEVMEFPSERRQELRGRQTPDTIQGGSNSMRKAEGNSTHRIPLPTTSSHDFQVFYVITRDLSFDLFRSESASSHHDVRDSFPCWQDPIPFPATRFFSSLFLYSSPHFWRRLTTCTSPNLKVRGNPKSCHHPASGRVVALESLAFVALSRSVDSKRDASCGRNLK